jgi:hypothetical protein
MKHDLLQNIREGNGYSIWKRRKRILNLEEKETNTQFGREGNEYSIWKRRK